jgi:general stress protein 26
MVSEQEKLDKLREIIKKVDICMLSTVDAEGNIHSRPLSNNREVEFDGDLWFFVTNTSGKIHEVEREPRVNASFADIDGRRYASLSGRGEVVNDRAKIKELWQPALKLWFPDGPDAPELTLLKVKAEQAEYWDASQPMLVHAVNIVKGLISGEMPDLGENEKIAAL